MRSIGITFEPEARLRPSSSMYVCAHCSGDLNFLPSSCSFNLAWVAVNVQHLLPYASQIISHWHRHRSHFGWVCHNQEAIRVSLWRRRRRWRQRWQRRAVFPPSSKQMTDTLKLSSGIERGREKTGSHYFQPCRSSDPSTESRRGKSLSIPAATLLLNPRGSASTAVGDGRSDRHTYIQTDGRPEERERRHWNSHERRSKESPKCNKFLIHPPSVRGGYYT